MNSLLSDSTSKTLLQHYSTNVNLKSLVDWLASKQNDSLTLKARVAAYRTGKTEPEMREVFKVLEMLGLGTYVTGRKGGKTRFEFSHSSRSLQNAARQGSLVQPIDEKAADDDAEDEVEPSSQSESLEHAFNLRGDFVVQLKLPKDFSSKEAVRLSTFINSLPMND